MTVSSVTQVCTDCQNICSGRLGGNLRTTVLRRSVPLTLACPWRFSLGLDRDWDFLAGSVVALDIGRRLQCQLEGKLLSTVGRIPYGLARFGNAVHVSALFNRNAPYDVERSELTSGAF